MATRTLLNVDNYRVLLLHNPAKFLDVVIKNNFIRDIKAELYWLTDEIRTIIVLNVDENDQPPLFAKLNVALGMRDRITNWMKYKFPRSIDPIINRKNKRKRLTLHRLYRKCVRSEEKAELMALNASNPFQSDDRQQLFFVPDPNVSISSSSNFRLFSDVCVQMKVHKRLTTIIEQTPIFSAGLNLINPNQTTPSPTDMMILHDNNSNETCLQK